ncbi:tRNA pseudouridine(38-40) synthase TruA [Changchengzhania lutea]|uniref:tRNA pseudouridine(38-40) synthase TruA n=1 Tax=Changchengzhania lutea TaxID=2049305 RepID=UPI00115E1549|nr:tRNA pseudouridine(38-40) synthase TruA [Changchengzhania lutea]
MRYFIELSYNGSAYHGWQNQPNAISVQELVEKDLSTLLKEAISVMGAGRTDTGVHAKQMYAHFDSNELIDEADIVFKMNSFLPKDIAIHKIFRATDDAHARFNAISRTYLYRVGLKKNAFNFNTAYYVKHPLDLSAMQVATRILFEYKDFQCFSKSKTDVKTYNCNIMKADWELVGDELHFTIQADRFLRNMVRAIVGTLINIGLKKISLEDFHAILESKDRREAGFSVPAKGLYLIDVEYPDDIKYK